MMRRFAILVCLCCVCGTVFAQRGKVRRDPMTEKEVEQMREFRDMPDKRIKVLNGIIRKRAELLASWEKDVKAVAPAERGGRTHDLLEDIVNLLDEFGDNVDTFLKEQADVCKPLQQSIVVFTSMQKEPREMTTA